jgi:hypothetical protein
MTFTRCILIALLATALTATLVEEADAIPCQPCPAGDQCDPTDGKCYPTCNPWCESDGRECGADGCGGSCGDCVPGQTCWEGQCTGECAPQCGAKVCGEDGCGGSCGWCLPDTYCQSGQCVDASQCVPNCMMIDAEGLLAPKQCGDNECGTICGVCAEDFGWVCDEFNYLCIECGSLAFPCPDATTDPETDPNCQPTCVGSECGPDGCGSTCGTCAAGLYCTHGICATCTPQCFAEGGVCQNDAQCDSGFLCNTATGLCRRTFLCGGDGCGGSCGTCDAGFSCIANTCQVAAGTCQPNCIGRSCGGDGCGGSCGTCTAGAECDSLGVCTGGQGEETNPYSSECPDGEYYNALAGGCVVGDGAGGSGGDGDAVGGGCQGADSRPGLLMLLLGLCALCWPRRRRRA